ATLDADGQNDPTDLLTLVERLRAEPTLAAVVGYRVRRADTRWKVVQSRIANAVRNRITGDVIRDTGCPLKALRRDVAQRLPRFDGMHRFIPTLIRVQGGTVIEMPVSHRARRAGASKYGMRDRALRGLTDALAVRWYRRRALDYEITEEIA
ncbi:MAG: glycosyltransferase, partial [Acidobacteria bacterium]|nr:glycosyltransferase [Acidobacteriota bacterium]NIQ29565.1 glycosyltransferase [Acidobacteriota bacterium]NIQ85135.1 glycosyltransferase [Acidobacteriota bacterium]